eukprot:m.155727 g.155727  ORF g.155727 m.155727 type:complete len:55 (+) comp17540_c0_seq4:350-514(+)
MTACVIHVPGAAVLALCCDVCLVTAVSTAATVRRSLRPHCLQIDHLCSSLAWVW